MKKNLLATALFAIATIAALSASAHDSDDNDLDSKRPLTIAVFGDWPYNQNLLANAARLRDSINADKDVRLVLHVGDVHSGSMPCTSADILPPIASANPGWNQKIFYEFQQFNAPVVYTPGDNEWTDCHKSKEKSSGDPLKELASIRKLFFSQPGHTLGMHPKRVRSQAADFDPAHPSDAKFVENMMWEDSRVVFVTLNMPGSNNDTAPWTGSFSNPPAQSLEVSERTGADIRWLENAFLAATKTHAKAVVIALQADMWDPEALANGELAAYTPFVRRLADLTQAFGGPVLLLNGDSHVYGADYPLADQKSPTGAIHQTQAVPNLLRITVQGSTTAPAEWLRLSINPRKTQPFNWENVAYCKDPLGSCQY